MKLTKNSSVVIVTAESATIREQFAASELCKYLRKIFPEMLVEISSSTASADMKILLGNPSRNKTAASYITEEALNALIPGPEGILLRTLDDKTLLVTGSEKDENEWERGTVYAVYELLERYFGCVFAGFMNPDIPGGEYIPVLSEADLTNVDYVKACADLEFRTAVPQYLHGAISPQHKLTLPFLDWLVKNRYNCIYTWASVYEEWKECGILDEAVRRGLRFLAGHHDTCDLFLPPLGNKYFPEHYAETHPEFFKVQEDGTTFVPTDFGGQWIYCSRNEELIDTFTNNMLAWISQNPAVDMINLSPRDGSAPGCCCEKCARYTKQENYLYFAKRIAERIKKEAPTLQSESLHMPICGNALKEQSFPIISLSTNRCGKVTERALWESRTAVALSAQYGKKISSNGKTAVQRLYITNTIWEHTPHISVGFQVQTNFRRFCVVIRKKEFTAPAHRLNAIISGTMPSISSALHEPDMIQSFPLKKISIPFAKSSAVVQLI